jgi:hypothetical protein
VLLERVHWVVTWHLHFLSRLGRMSVASTSVRFGPAPFKYNGRVAAALVPSLLVAAGLGGRAVMGVFTVGTMLWYIMDAMQYREGAFTVVGWLIVGSYIRVWGRK